MLSIFLSLLLVLFFWMTGWFFIAVYFNRIDIVDMVWGLTYGLIAIYLFFIFQPSFLTIVPLVFVILWSVRLVMHISSRLKKHSEDSRYAALRISWGKYFYLKSYFFIFLLQGFFIAVISLPILFLSVKNISLSPQFIFGGMLWIMGFLCELIADRQMMNFRHDAKNKGKIIQTGFWKYSRHPNYFGEILMWWSLYFMSIQSVESLVGFLSPFLLTYLIVYVTGIPLLEANLRTRKGYDEYVRRTNILIPFLQKKKIFF